MKVSLRQLFFGGTLALLIAASGGARAQIAQGWALVPEVPIADGEDEGEAVASRYFAFGPYSFEFRALDAPHGLPGVNNTTKAVVLFGEEGHPDLTVQAPEGTLWDLDTVWASADQSILIWRAQSGPTSSLQFVSTSPFELLLTLPLAASHEAMDAGPQATILDNRLYFPAGVPEMLYSAFPPEAAIFKHVPAWREIAWAHHAVTLIDTLDSLLPALDNVGDDPSSKQSAAEAHKLLAMQPQPIALDAIGGDWKVRSIQASPGFCYAYPFFKARFEPRDGLLFFEKTTGSQRRSGFLYPDTPTTAVFLGGSTVNENPQVPYSGTVEPTRRSEASSKESDTYGRLFRLGPDHLLLVLDVDSHGNFELYDLKR